MAHAQVNNPVEKAKTKELQQVLLQAPTTRAKEWKVRGIGVV